MAADGAVPLSGQTAVERARALRARVDEVEPRVLAWAHLDRAHFLRQAAAADAVAATGPLHGVAVGLKDIIDTADLPTENGTVLHAGRRPTADAVLVRRLRAAGALVMGKTVTTELATYAPGPTRNPHDPAHTPGGSSSGSAAAVAAGMVPLAVGTQTNGSVIRPASFCGVVGYKPSAGLIPRTGVLVQSPSIDCIGVFARSVPEVALLAEALAGHDPQDPLTRPFAVPSLHRTAVSEPPVAPRLLACRTPWWHLVAPDAQAAFEAFSARFGFAPVDLPPGSLAAVAWHRTVMEAEIAGSFEALHARGAERLSASLCGQIDRGRRVPAVEVRRALAGVPGLLAAVEAAFDDADALVTPAALGTAPAGLDSTGDPILCTLTSLLGLPTLSLPLLHGANGLPLGVQIIGRRGDDARLLRTARWLAQTVQVAI